MHHRRVIWAALVLAAVLAGCGYGETGDEGARTLNWYAYNEPGGSFDEIAKECSAKSGGRYQIKVVKLPQDADQQRELLVRRLAAEDSDIDLMTMDVIWTGEFAEAGWVLEWKGPDAREARKVFEGMRKAQAQRLRRRGVRPSLDDLRGLTEDDVLAAVGS